MALLRCAFIFLGLFAHPPAYAASIEELDLIVFARPAPKRVRLVEGECRTAPDRPVAQSLEARGKRVRVCGRLPDQRQRSCEDLPMVQLECAHPVVLQAGDEIRAYGTRLSAQSKGGRLRLVAAVEIESYVAGVVDVELGGAPLEARRAQAILARSYAARAFLEPRHREAPLCDGQHCQAFKGLVHPRFRKEVDQRPAQTTLSEILIESDGRPTPVFFHAACGGHTVAALRLWPGAAAPDVVGVQDKNDEGLDWCRASPHHRWKSKLPSQEVATALQPLVDRKLDPRSLRLEPEEPDGLVWRVGDRGGVRRVPGARLQSALSRRFGFLQVRSTRFTVRRHGTELWLSGAGLGHGVGLCQAGASARAQAGQEAHQILEAYFPKLRLKTGPLR